MSIDLRELYQEVILDHNRHPRNKGVLDEPTAQAEGHNPLCGDQVTVYLKTDGEKITAVQFEGSGCAISTASASLMTEALVGKKPEEAEALFRKFQSMVSTDEETGGEDLFGEMGELAALAGVREHPVRIKCATLPWHTMHSALAGADKPISTE